MAQNQCPVCFKESNFYCSNCKKVVYCGKEHQKLHRKEHKRNCFPAEIRSHPLLGQHLQATRDISPGERIFKEEPLIIGPRSNLSHFHKICLGCCDQIESNDSTCCSQCKWPVCDIKCEKNPRHAEFECPILSKAKVRPATSQEEYLCITFLRCILLQTVDPKRWDELLKFESHVILRNARPICVEQSHFAVHFIKDRCKMTDVEPKLIDFIYGIVIVNGYGDTHTFAVKLYSKCAKLSHACIPNTRTVLDSTGLEILSTIPIKAGQPLTQLYGRIMKGTHRRQELLQNIYYFSCNCLRCKDPTELNTFFSAVKCSMKRCKGYLLPKDPLDVSPTSKWKCNCCNNSSAYIRCVGPALQEIHKEAGTNENDGWYCEYEIYGYDNLNVPMEGNYLQKAITKLEHITEMLKILRRLETSTVHKNHYALLPLKTALIASSHALLTQTTPKTSNKILKDALLDPEKISSLLSHLLKLVQEVLEVMDILLPGMTPERGILLFYLSESLRLSTLHQPNYNHPLLPKMKQFQDEALKIMVLENPEDPQRILVLSSAHDTD